MFTNPSRNMYYDRDNCDVYERKGKELSKTESYVINMGTKRQLKRKAFPGEKREECVTGLNRKEDMKINTVYVVTDRLCTELDTKSEVYFSLNEIFGFFYNLSLIPNDKIRKKASAFGQKISIRHQ